MTKNSEKKVQCPHCSSRFKRQRDLDSHVKAKHGKKSSRQKSFSSPTLKALGDGFYELKNYKRAKAMYERYLKLSPGDVAIRSRLNSLRYLFPKRRKVNQGDKKNIDGPKKIKKYASEAKVDKDSHIHLFWWFGRLPNQRDHHVLKGYLEDQGAKFMWQDSANIHYRSFNKGKTSLHVEIELTKVGFKIRAHVDIEVHGRVVHNTQSRNILKGLAKILKTSRGRVFFLPREKKALEQFINRVY